MPGFILKLHCHIPYRGVSHKQLLRQYDVEKAEETLTNKKTQRDDMQAQKVTQTTIICSN